MKLDFVNEPSLNTGKLGSKSSRTRFVCVFVNKLDCRLVSKLDFRLVNRLDCRLVNRLANKLVNKLIY